MSELVRISFENQEEDLKDRVEGYWSKRADSFFTLKAEEAESQHKIRWGKELKRLLPTGECLKILDVGCGAGFFEAVLGELGYQVIGIDLTEEMVGKAEEMIRLHQLDSERVRVMSMDAEKLAFADETFDAVVTRNLTWTLPHPQKAYREWHRVLKKGGVLLNFDAEYAKHAHENLYSEKNKAHQELSLDMKDECHQIYHMLTISTLERPVWDREVLQGIGFEQVETEVDFGDRIFLSEDKFYIPDRLFSIRAVK